MFDLWNHSLPPEGNFKCSNGIYIRPFLSSKTDLRIWLKVTHGHSKFNFFVGFPPSVPDLFWFITCTFKRPSPDYSYMYNIYIYIYIFTFFTWNRALSWFKGTGYKPKKSLVLMEEMEETLQKIKFMSDQSL